MKQKGFTLIELLVVVAIIGTLTSVGVVAYNGYVNSSKNKTSEFNYSKINKSLMYEFMKCELDSSNTILGNHKCSNSQAPSISTISNYITSNLNINNPYGNKLISSSPCSSGTITITSPSKGNYSVSFYSAPQKKITTTTIGTTYTPVKVGLNTKYTNVNTGCNTAWKNVNTGSNTSYSNPSTNKNTSYQPVP